MIEEVFNAEISAILLVNLVADLDPCGCACTVHDPVKDDYKEDYLREL